LEQNGAERQLSSKVGNKGELHSFSNRFCIFAGLENVLSHGVCSFRQGNGSLSKYFGKSAEGKVRIADANMPEGLKALALEYIHS